MADENKTPEEEIFETYLQDANFTEEQKTAVLDALIEVGKRRNNPDYKAPEGKSVEEDVLDDYLKNNELSDEQMSTVLNAMISAEQQRLTREAAEISENLDNLSAEELESLASNWARTPGADELRAKIAARQEELRANVETNNNDVLSNTTDNSNAEKGQNQEQKAESEQEQVVELKQAAENSASDNKTGTTEDEIFQEGTPVNVYNAVDVSKNLNDMLPSQLYTLRRALNARTNDETQAASAKLDDHIVTQAGKYAKDKMALTDMEEVYALNDLLTLVRVYPQSEKAQSESGKNELNAAIEKSGTEIQNFEEQYGIDKEHLQAPQVVESNIVKLDGLPQDKEIFALDVREERMQSPTEYQDVIGILNTAQKTGNAPELSVLTGALQCNDLTEDQKKTLLELAEKRVNDTKSLSFGDFKNFEYLLTALKEAPNADKISSTLKKKEKLLSDARQAYAKSAPLKNKEFQDVYNVLSSLKVNGELKAFGREQLDQGGMDSDIALFLDQTRRETEMYLANTGKTVTPEVFSQEYAARLRNNLIEVVYADQFSKGRISEKDFGAMFDRLTAAAQSKKGININQDSFIGWQAARTNRIDTAVNKLGQKQGYENAAKSFGARVKAIDQKLTQKYGKAYSLVKGCLKSAGWGAAYSIAGAAFGPAGIAAVATASFANQAYGFIKNFKKEREAAKAKGEKPASFWQYIKKNKLRTAGLLLSGATAAIGIGGVGGNAAVQIARSAAGIGLAASGAIHQAAQAYKSTQGSKGKKTWKAIQTALFSGASFYAGMLAGREAGEIASEAFADPAATPNVTPTLDDADTKGTDTQVVDTPVIDVNNLTAEQQHDLQMLFSRDPAEANQILGLKGDQWMNSEQLQQAWVDGTLTPEQKALLIEFGGQRFDEHGNFQDVEGYKPADEMEAETKEWTEKHSNTEQRDNTSPDIMPDALSAEDVEVKQIINDRESGITTIISEGPNGEQLSTTVPLDESPLKHLDSVQYNDDGSINVSRTLEDGTEMTGTIYQGDKVDEYTFSRDGMTFTDTNDWNLDEGKGAYESLMGDRTEASQTVADNYNAENGIKPEATEHTSENTGRTSTEEAVHSTPETPATPEAPQPQATEVEQPATPTNEARESDVEVNKIKINDDKVKIVGQTDDGRIVARTDTEALQSHGLPDDYDYKNIQYADNGDISFRMQGENGNTIAITLDEDGHYKSINTGSKEYTPEEIKYINNEMDQHPDALQRNLDQYKSLQTLRDNLEEGLDLSNKTPQPQTTEVNKPETPVQEPNGMDIQTNVQVTQEGDMIHTHTDTQTTMSDNTVLSSGLTYSEVQNEAYSQLGMYKDNETGVYTYGLGQSHNLEMARTEHDLAMKDAYVNHEVLQGLEAKGDNLTPEESALKDQCLQKQNDYAERGLTIDENGKPVFAAELLKPEVQQKLHDDYIKEMENGLDLKDVTVKNMNNGDVKIAGEIDGQQVEGRMDKNGDFKNLTINGEKVTGDELTQFNEELKYKNEALHNIVTDEAKLEAKLNETDDQRNAPLGEKVVQEQPAQETLTQEAPVQTTPAPQPQATEVEQPATPTNEARESDVEVNKIKINDDKVKIVGQTDDGRIVARTDTEALQSHGLPDDYDYKNIQYADNGDISFRMQGENGNTIAITLDEDGHYKSINTGSKEYTPEEIKYINNEMDQHPDALQRNLDQYKSLQTLRDNLEEGLDLSNKTPQPQTTEVNKPETPVQEPNGMDIQTNVQVTQEGDMIHTHTDTQTTMSDNTVLSSGLTYSEVQNEAAEQLGLHHDEQNGVYTYGLGQSHDIETARTEHDLAMRDAYVNHEVLQGLEAKGDNLTPEESALKDQCLQKQNDYAERGLTIDENGKPVFDDKLLSGKALEARNAERVAEAEKNLNMEDVSVQQAQGGDIKISGEINGQNIEGRLNENGEFEKLSIDGQKIKGNDLEQYNEENKINNQAIHKSAADKIAELRGLKQDSSTPAPVKGERTMINNAQLNATKGGRE